MPRFTLFLLIWFTLPLAGTAQVVDLPDPNLRTAIEGALGKTKGATITVAEMATLTELRASEIGISHLTGLETATNLTFLWLDDNKIADLSPLAGLTQLTYLMLGNNSITDISVLAGLTNLSELGLWENTITDISALAGLTNLTWLGLDGNNITNISVLAGLTNLTSLGLSGNPIADLSPLIGLTNLTSLSLGLSDIGDISFLTGLTNLTSLGLALSSISDLSPLAGLTNLTHLDLWENNITDLSPLAGLTNLTHLSLDGNAITDISPLAGLTNLTHLNLWENDITDLSPLAGLTNLTHLSLDGNAITDISPLAGLTNLISLGLDNNHISDLSPLVANTGLGAGDYVYVVDNLLSDLSVNTHIPTLQGRGVTVWFDASENVDTSFEDPDDGQVDITDPKTNLPIAQVDINQDGQVNIIDLLLVVSTLGDSTPALVFADVNGDSWVTIDDVMLVIEALDDPITAAAPAIAKEFVPVNAVELEARLNRLRSQSDGSLKYQRAIDFLQNLLLAVARPDKTELLANYPNPFNPETWIPYRLAEDAFVTLTIYDQIGQVVRTIDVGHQAAATYEHRSRAIYWDGRNTTGEAVASGIYFYHLSAGDYSQTRKMLILK